MPQQESPTFFSKIDVVCENLPPTSYHDSMTFAGGRVIFASSDIIQGRLLWADPQNGQQGTITTQHGVTYQLSNNKTTAGEPIVKKKTGDDTKWMRINLETWQLVDMDNHVRAREPDVIGFTSSGEEISYNHSSKRIERYASVNGELVETIKVTRVSGILETMCVAEKGVYFNTGEALVFWPYGQEEKDAMIVAGSSSQSGNKDGFGRRARFKRLQALVHSRGSRYIYVAQDVYGTSRTSRLARFDTETDFTQTIDLRSISLESFSARIGEFFCSDGEDLYIFARSGSRENRVNRLIKASTLKPDASDAIDTGMETWLNVNLKQDFRKVEFHLADGTIIYFDERILKARSDYFQKMLSSSCTEASDGKIDMTKDPSISVLALECVLRYIATDTFLKPTEDELTPDQLFEVRDLADRYQVLGLRDTVSTHVTKHLTVANVLQYLSHVFGRGDQLETACWAIVDTNREEVLGQSQESITALIRENPELGSALLLRGSKYRRKS
eukprot:TRINITY_DN25836_c1_g1_i1.p1 TRINITY_DN25836_c1_g1~~TRINITY_DN25836_c1_g1_i1.p1  ORF type:complete len:501 (+),score=48.41 TRINITY_DN25836_c1_g1_i1:91-1593(+)